MQSILDILKPSSLIDSEIGGEIGLSSMLSYRAAVANAWFGRHKIRAVHLRLNVAKFCLVSTLERDPSRWYSGDP